MQKKSVSTIFLGDASVGKTSIIHWIVYGCSSPDVSQSVAVECFKKDNIVFYDTAGQERFRSMTPNYIRLAQICVIVFDITDSETLNSVEYWHKMVLEQVNNAKILLVGNKRDKEDERKVQVEDALNVAEELGIPEDWCFETSALTGTNINELFKKIQEIAENETLPEPPIIDNKIEINHHDNNNQSKSRCC